MPERNDDAILDGLHEGIRWFSDNSRRTQELVEALLQEVKYLRGEMAALQKEVQIMREAVASFKDENDDVSEKEDIVKGESGSKCSRSLQEFKVASPPLMQDYLSKNAALPKACENSNQLEYLEEMDAQEKAFIEECSGMRWENIKKLVFNENIKNDLANDPEKKYKNEELLLDENETNQDYMGSLPFENGRIYVIPFQIGQALVPTQQKKLAMHNFFDVEGEGCFKLQHVRKAAIFESVGNHRWRLYKKGKIVIQ